jgi:O-acetyl-ADP-ribose deacetylase (regulator of RNase III)
MIQTITGVAHRSDQTDLTVYVAMRIELVQGDITTLNVDVIVNAANETLLGGGGVDGAIHRAAGPELRWECAKLGGCETGDAKVTAAYKLPAKHIIHTVGPIWEGGTSGEPAQLASCYRKSLQLAAGLRATSIAFPAISTGVYGYPLRDAAEMSIKTILAHPYAQPERIVLCTFDDETTEATREMLAALTAYGC